MRSQTQFRNCHPDRPSALILLATQVLGRAVRHFTYKSEVPLGQRAPVQIKAFKGRCPAGARARYENSARSTPATKAVPNFTILGLSYRNGDADTSALPLFTSKALFVAGKGRFGFTFFQPKKCEGPRHFSIAWFLQVKIQVKSATRLEWPWPYWGCPSRF